MLEDKATKMQGFTECNRIWERKPLLKKEQKLREEKDWSSKI